VVDPGSHQYAIEGNITLTGGAVQWAGEMLGLPDARAVAALAASVSSSDGVYMVPAMAVWARRTGAMTQGE